MTHRGADDVRAGIRDFLSRYSDDPDWLDGDELFTSGVVSSLLAMELVTYLESTYGIVVGTDDLDLANFNSIDGMVRLVVPRMQPRA